MPPPPNAIDPEQPALPFGEVWVGQSRSSPIAWLNPKGPATTIENFLLNPQGQPFTAPTTGSVPVPAAGASHPIPFDFHPTAEGTFYTSAEPVLSFAAPLIANPLALSGTAKARAEFGDLALAPPGYVPPIGPFGANHPLDFGNIPVGGHAYRTLTLHNTGAAALTIAVTILKPATGYFTVSSQSGGTPLTHAPLPPHGALTVIVTFTPLRDSKDPFTDVLCFSTNAGDLAAIVLTGRAHRAAD